MKILISAGVVLFNPDPIRLKMNLDAISSQVDDIFLIDNGSNNIAQIDELVSMYPTVQLIRNNKNLGIAHALNQIIDQSKQANYDWTLTLDQDSVVAEHLVSKYADYIHAHGIDKNIGMLTCQIQDRNFDDEASRAQLADVSSIDYCITSGSLLNLAAADQVGGFDDQMFIDKVDADICIHLRLENYQLFRINYVGLLHEVGHARQINLIFRKWELYNHSPFRRYYMCRNAVYLVRKYPKSLFVKRMLFKEYFQTFLVLLFENKRLKKLKKSLSGYRDGRTMKLTDIGRR